MAAQRLNITRPTEPEAPPKLSAQIKGALFAAVLLVVALYLLNNTSIQLALAVLALGVLWYWREAYQRRVQPLVAGGLTQPEALVFIFMQLLWLGPLYVGMALFASAKYSAL